MPSIEQCETATGNLATLSSTLEIFDKFKPTSDAGKDSDSEESFHLVYDEDENQSVLSNGKEKDAHFEESEEDILNKFDTAHSGTPDNLDSAVEDSLLNEADFSSETKEINSSSVDTDIREKPNCLDTVIHIDVNIQEEGYENFENGEFKSAYEDDAELHCNEQEISNGTTEPMETNVPEEQEKDNAIDAFEDSMDVEQDIATKDIENIIETLDKSDANVEDIPKDAEPTQENSNEDVEMTDDLNLNENPVEQVEELNEKVEDSQESVSTPVESEISDDKTEEHVEQASFVRTRSMRKKEGEKPNSDVQEELQQNEEGSGENDKKENVPTTETEQTEEETKDDGAELSVQSSDKSDEDNNEETVLPTDKDKKSEEDVFKIPQEIPKLEEPPNQEGPDLQNEKSNDKTDDDESDLLDISMIRETEEDDACAIADAIEDNEISEREKEAQTSEKSDEEQSEKVDTEQEGSEGDEREEDNENINEQLGFEEDDDSRMDIAENDNSNIEASSDSDKNNEITENLKESSPVDSDTQKTDQPESSSETPIIECEENTSELTSDVQESTDLNSSQDNELSVVNENSESFSVEESANEENTETIAQDNLASDIDKTEKDSEKSSEECNQRYSQAIPLPDVPRTTENSSDQQKANKRPRTELDLVDSTPSVKKPKLTENEMPSDSCEAASRKTQEAFGVNEKIQTLTTFSKFMQSRKFTNKLSRSDLEQLCIQKICECLVLKSKEGEMYQTIKQQQRTIDNLRKDLQQVSKQSKDLEIVHKKLISELKNESAVKKPLLPLRITRSVGLQVRLNPVNETQTLPRRRPSATTTPQKQPIVATKSPANANRSKTTPAGQAQQQTVVRQIGQTSPQKSPLTTAQTTMNTQTNNTILSHALQPKPRQSLTTAKRTTVSPQIRKVAEVAKPNNPGVIDLTDEDDRLAAAKTGNNAIKNLNKTNTTPTTPHKVTHKIVPGKTVLTQGKQIGIQKAVVGANKTGTLSPGIRLTPASVITSSANGSPQMVYVVPTTLNSGGTQKVALLNFQPANGVLAGTLGQTVSVMSNKQGQTLTLKTVSSPVRHKHPAPLPAPPRINLDSKLKPLLPKPHLTIKKIDTGIILQWKMPYNLDMYESIASYQLYAYQETSAPPSTDMWRKVGDVKALALPMACTLTQFADKNKYYFAVRSVDIYKRIGAFSDPEQISL